MRIPSRSTCSTDVIFDPGGTRYVASISTYAGVKSISFARCGSAPRKPTSHTPVFAASASRPGFANGTSCTGTPRRRPSSRPRSGATPPDMPSDSVRVSRKLDMLRPTRSVPVGARFLTTDGSGCAITVFLCSGIYSAAIWNVIVARTRNPAPFCCSRSLLVTVPSTR